MHRKGIKMKIRQLINIGKKDDIDTVLKCEKCKVPLIEEWYYENYNINIGGTSQVSGSFQKYTGRYICPLCNNVYVYI